MLRSFIEKYKLPIYSFIVAFMAFLLWMLTGIFFSNTIPVVIFTVLIFSILILFIIITNITYHWHKNKPLVLCTNTSVVLFFYFLLFAIGLFSHSSINWVSLFFFIIMTPQVFLNIYFLQKQNYLLHFLSFLFYPLIYSLIIISQFFVIQ